MSDSVGSVSVDVVPDARGWSEKLRAQIRDYTAHVKVEADTGEAEAQLDEVARNRTSRVKVDVDKSRLEQGANALDSFIGNLGLLPSLAITAGAALVPLAATLGGVAVALAAPLAIAGGGATLFAFLGGFAVKDTEKRLKTISELDKKLSGLTKGTKEYAQVQKQLKDAQNALTPSQKKFAEAQQTLVGAFQKLLSGKTGDALLGTIAQGMTVLAHILPGLAPVITAVGGAISSLLGDIDRATQGPGFSHFIDQFARLAGRDIRLGGKILGDLAKGVGALLTQTDKGFSGGFLHGIEGLTRSFADWANSPKGRKEVHDFFDYVHRVGPQVADTVGAIARGAGHFVKAIAPLGPPVLRVIEGIADAFSRIPIPVLTALAGATAGLVAFQKVGGFKAVGFIGGLSGGKSGGGPLGGLVTGGVQKVFVVNMPPGGVGGAGGGGFLGKLGLAGAELTAIAAAPSVLKKEYGRTLGGAVSDALRLPDPAVGQLGLHAASNVYNYFFKKPAPAPVEPPSAHLDATTTKVDALHAHLASASRQIDLIGPRADAAFGAAGKDVDIFAGKLAAIHDKKIAVILQDQAAIRSLQALQAYRLQDKNLNIYAHYQGLERAVGPGGGAGQLPHGSGGGGARIDVHLNAHVDENGYVRGTAQDVYNQNQRFEVAHR